MRQSPEQSDQQRSRSSQWTVRSVEVRRFFRFVRKSNPRSRANGGYITRGEQAQLNREENGVQRQIDRDSSGGRSGRGGGLFAMNHPRRAEVLGETTA